MPDKFIDEVRDNYRVGKDAWRETYSNLDRNLDFVIGNQWEEKMKRERGSERPAIVINQCRPKVIQVVNQFRANRPGPKVSPVDNINDPAMAQVHEGLCRNTDYVSNADVAYDTCFEYATAGCIGFFGLTFDYISPESHDKACKVRRFEDPKNLICDPSASDPNGADANWFIVRQRLSKRDYERKYGKAHKETLSKGWLCEGIDSADWVEYEHVWVAEYWSIDYQQRELARVGPDMALFTDDPRFQQFVEQSGLTSHDLELRKVDYPRVNQHIINGVEILDEVDFPGKRIPIWMVCGGELWVRGKRHITGLLDDARTPQMLLNYAESLNIEALAMAPKPKWLIAEGTDEGYEDEYANANRSSRTALHYKPVTFGGQQAPPPQFVVFEPKSQAMDVVAARSNEYIKSVTGQYDSSLGNIDPRAHSGKAIQALQQQGFNSSSHITDNFNRALKLRYQAEIEINQEIMSPDQMVRVLGPDQKQNVQQLKNSFFDGKYDVIVSAGPTEQSQRESVKDFVMQLPQSDPQGWGIVRDIAVKLMDLGPVGDEIAKRWTPPQYADPNQQVPPEVQQQMAQMHQALQQTQQQLQQASQIIQTKQVEEGAKHERELARLDKEYRIALLQQETQLLMAQVKANATLGEAEINMRLGQVEAALGYDSEAKLLQAKQQHDFAMAAAQNEHDAEQAQQAQQAQQEQQNADQPPAS